LDIYNEIGEVVNAIITPWVVEKPDQQCEITKECPPPEEVVDEVDEDGDFVDSDDTGRRLAKSKNLEQLTAKEEEGDWSETITEKSDGCDYTKTCV